jgi:hypothetical protein
MGVWNWLARSTAGDARRLGSPEPASSPRIVLEVAERERSVDGLNSWQREQVREIIREEIAALIPALMATPHLAPPPPHLDGPHTPTLPLGRGEPDGARPYVA